MLNFESFKCCPLEGFKQLEYLFILCFVFYVTLGGRDHCAGPGEDLQRSGEGHAQVCQSRLAAQIRRCDPPLSRSLSVCLSLSLSPYLSCARNRAVVWIGSGSGPILNYFQ